MAPSPRAPKYTILALPTRTGPTHGRGPVRTRVVLCFEKCLLTLPGSKPLGRARARVYGTARQYVLFWCFSKANCLPPARGSYRRRPPLKRRLRRRMMGCCPFLFYLFVAHYFINHFLKEMWHFRSLRVCSRARMSLVLGRTLRPNGPGAYSQ